MPRPGFVLDVDRSTPPILFHHGEGFRLETPARRPQPRCIYPAEPLDGAQGPRRRHPPRARSTRSATASPCPPCCTPGMKLTIAFDDISLPLPPMRRPDIRQRVIEAVLDLAAAAGVDDVHLIAALALHRRMTEAELRHAVGDRVYDAFAPHGLLYNHDAEDPDNLAFLGDDRRRARRSRSTSGPPRATCSSTSTSTSCRWTAAGSRTATGLASYRSLRHHHNVHTMQHSAVVHGPAQLRAALVATGAWARCSQDAGVKVFQIETTLNNDIFGTDGPHVACCRSASGSGPPATAPRSSA